MKKRGRKAKRSSRYLILARQSSKLYDIGYLDLLESKGLIHRNTFYKKVKARTLPNEVADQISKLLQVKTSDWYEGQKALKLTTLTVEDHEPVLKIPVESYKGSNVDLSDLDELF